MANAAWKKYGWSALEKVYERLKHGDDISEKDVTSAIHQLKIITNAETAAYLLTCVIAPFCAYKNELNEKLLPEVLLPLVYSGLETPEQVIKWLSWYLDKPDPFDDTPKEAIDWIKELATQPDVIQKYLNQVIKENDEFNLQETYTRFSPYSHIPLERIQFHYYWRDDFVEEKKASIFFFEFSSQYGADEESQLPEDKNPLIRFGKLTEILAKHDVYKKLELVVFDYEAFNDFLFHLEHQQTRTIFPHLKPLEAQIMWLCEGKVLHFIGAETKDFAIFEQNTVDLLLKCDR